MKRSDQVRVGVAVAALVVSAAFILWSTREPARPRAGGGASAPMPTGPGGSAPTSGEDAPVVGTLPVERI
jgi:hypothetical protein